MIGYTYMLLMGLNVVECLSYSACKDTYLVMNKGCLESESFTVIGNRVLFMDKSIEAINGRRSHEVAMMTYSNIQHQENRCWRKFEKSIDTGPRVVVSCESGKIEPTFKLGEILCTNH